MALQISNLCPKQTLLPLFTACQNNRQGLLLHTTRVATINPKETVLLPILLAPNRTSIILRATPPQHPIQLNPCGVMPFEEQGLITGQRIRCPTQLQIA